MTNLPEISDAAEQLPPKRTKTWLITLALLAILAGGSLGWLAVKYFRGELALGEPEWHGLYVEGAGRPPNFVLTDQTGQRVKFYDFHGRVVLIYFGYTYCPDICPATMSELVKVKELLGNKANEIEVVLITIDPERDTPEHLAEYLSFFDPTFIGLTGTEEEIIAATTPFGIYYKKHEGTIASGYLLDHTATVMVVDKQGELRLVYPFGITGEEIAADMRFLIRD